MAPQAPQRQPFVHLNWSNFKPEFSGKPDEDAEAHLLHTNDWMDTHHFIDGVKVQRFSLTLFGEARLWYQSLEPINGDWQGIQNLFRQHYSKIGNTREQLFHAWRSFNFDENLFFFPDFSCFMQGCRFWSAFSSMCSLWHQLFSSSFLTYLPLCSPSTSSSVFQVISYLVSPFLTLVLSHDPPLFARHVHTTLVFSPVSFYVSL